MSDDLEEGEIIQLKPEHKWGGCLAIVAEVKSFGCLAYITVPDKEARALVYIRLLHDEFERVGAKPIFLLTGIET